METAKFNLFSEVKPYIKLSQNLQTQLSNRPDNWPKFQQIFNSTLDKLYGDILILEKEGIDKLELNIYQLKKIFEKRYRRYFLYGNFIKWSFEKPFGYAGDFKITDDIYQNKPQTKGFDRLWDNYFQQLAITESVRERKGDFKKIIKDFVKRLKDRDVRIMNLASGSAREIRELIEADSEDFFSKVIFDCYDADKKAIDYATRLLNGNRRINFFQKNALRLALKKDIRREIPYKYDLIYSTGLFDYLDKKIATKLISNLKVLLKDGGIIVISNVADKYNNSSAAWMEWVAEWYLIYRDEDEFKKIFLDAGFSTFDLKIMPQRSKVMQYCIAHTQ